LRKDNAGAGALARPMRLDKLLGWHLGRQAGLRLRALKGRGFSRAALVANSMWL